jgi:hypothetical protein
MKETTYYMVIYKETAFAFVGADPTPRKLKRLQDIATKHGKKFVQVKHLVHPDDGICVFRQKLKEYANIDGIYMWCNTIPTRHHISKFLCSIFRGRDNISGKDFAKYIGYAFSTKPWTHIQERTTLSFEKALSFLTTNASMYQLQLGYRVVDEEGDIAFPIDPESKECEDFRLGSSDEYTIVDEEKMSIEFYNCADNVIYVHNPTLTHMTFKSSHSIDVLQTDKDLKDMLASTLPTTIVCKPSFVQVSVPHLRKERKTVDMYTVFSSVHLNEKVPFVKWVSYNKTMFKLNVKWATRAIDQVRKWSKVDKTRYMKSSREMLVCKVCVSPEIIATIVIVSSGVFDIKLNFKNKDHVSHTQLTDFVIDINKAVHHTFGKLINLSTFDRNDNLLMTKMVTTGSTTDNAAVVDLEELYGACTRLPSFFHVLRTSAKEKLITLLYKRCDSVRDISESNVYQYISKLFAWKNSVKPDASEIASIFGISLSLANKYLSAWNPKHYYNSSSLKMIYVTIKIKQLGYSFTIDGSNSIMQSRRILAAFCYATRIKSAKVKIPKALENAEFNFNFGDDDEDDEEGFDEEVPNDIVTDTEATEDNNVVTGNDVDEVDLEIIKRKTDMTCPKVSNIVNPTHVDRGVDRGRILINELKKADKEIFEETSDPKHSFAKTCQAATNRQPVVMSGLEVAYNNKCFPDALSATLNYGSTKELAEKNNYSCPQIWCPKSRVALTAEQFAKYKNRCPFSTIDEEPMDFTQTSRHIGFMSHTKSPTKKTCFLCCYKKPTAANQKCHAPTDLLIEDEVPDENLISKMTNKYILAFQQNFPVGESRYGLLPLHLSNFLGNKVCGGVNNLAGLITDKTDCFVRKGIKTSNQPFLQALCAVLNNPNLNTHQDVSAAIVKNLSFIDFLGLSEGKVCRHFFSLSFESIYDLDNFKQFKMWFLHKNNVAYKTRFFLDVLDATLQAKGFSKDLPFANIALREFKLYNAYVNFLKYISDQNVKKMHDFVLPIALSKFEWMNVNNYNIVIVESGESGDSHLVCQSASYVLDPDQPLVVLLNQDIFYEPIYHIKHNPSSREKKHKGIMTYEYLHDIAASPRMWTLAHAYISVCEDASKSVLVKNYIDSSLNASVQIIGFDLRVLGYYEQKSHVVIPLKQTVAMDFVHRSKFAFIDVFYSEFKSDVTRENAMKVLKRINTYVGEDYYVAVGGMPSSNDILLLDGIDTPVPLAAYKTIKDQSTIRDIMRNGEIFTSIQLPDERTRFILASTYDEINYLTLRNEIIHFAQHQKTRDMMETLLFLRHESNPMPSKIKMDYLRQHISEMMPRVAHITKKSMIANAPITSRPTNICSQISQGLKDSEGRCKFQCTEIVGDETTNRCKLRITHTRVNFYIDKCIDYLLNPANDLVVVDVVPNQSYQGETIIYDDGDDLESVLHKLSYIGLNYVNKLVDASTVPELKRKSTATTFVGGVAIPIPTWLRKTLKEFTITTTEEYNKNWLFSLFYSLWNVKTKTSMDDFREIYLRYIMKSLKQDFEGTKGQMELFSVSKKSPWLSCTRSSEVIEAIQEDDYYPTEFDVNALCDVLKINAVVIFKKTKTTGSVYEHVLRCFGKYSSSTMVVLQKKVVDDHSEFYLYSKHGKYVFSANAFPQEFAEIVKTTCSRYI